MVPEGDRHRYRKVKPRFTTREGKRMPYLGHGWSKAGVDYFKRVKSEWKERTKDPHWLGSLTMAWENYAEKENVCSFWKKVKPSDDDDQVPGPAGDDDIYDDSDDEEDIDPKGHSEDGSRGQHFEKKTEGYSEGGRGTSESEEDSDVGSESESDDEEDEDDRNKGEEEIMEKTPAKKRRQKYDGDGSAKRRKKVSP